MASANMMVLLSLLIMDILLFLYYTLPSSPGFYASASTALRRASSGHHASQETLL